MKITVRIHHFFQVGKANPSSDSHSAAVSSLLWGTPVPFGCCRDCSSRTGFSDPDVDVASCTSRPRGGGSVVADEGMMIDPGGELLTPRVVVLVVTVRCSAAVLMVISHCDGSSHGKACL